LKKRKKVLEKTSVSVGPRALLRTLDVLAFLSGRTEGATLTEIAQTLRVPASSLLAILRVLVNEGYLKRQATAYCIGLRSSDLAQKILGENQLGVLARGLMTKLSRDVGETVVLARADDRRKCIVCTDVVEGAASVRYAVAVGTTRPYYASAAGRVVLAHKDDSWVQNYLDNTSLHGITAQTVTSRSRLLETLKNVRRSGVSLSFEEATDGGAGIAAPILSGDGKLLGVLSIGAIASRARRDNEKYVNAVREAAAELSALVGALTKIA
jgi:IclR family transcriptional regulator, acetate operon repressor